MNHDEIRADYSCEEITTFLADQKQAILGTDRYEKEFTLVTALAIIDTLLNERAWLPIESAPKDGTKVMLYVGDFLECITASWFWDTSENIWKNTIGQWMVETHITHWMPLPQPPNTKEIE